MAEIARRMALKGFVVDKSAPTGPTFDSFTFKMTDPATVSSEPTMNKASATSSPELGKTEKMLLIAKNYWDYTNQPIVFVAPTMVIAADVRNRFFRLIESCRDVIENPRRVRCLSLCEPDVLKSLRGTRNTAFFFDHTCLERSDLLEAAGKLVNAIRENRLGEAVTPCHAGFIGAIAKRVPCPWGREDGRETFYPADYLPMNDPSNKVADSAARQIRRQDELDALRYALEAKAKEKESKRPSTDLKPRRVVDKLRINDILAAMFARNTDDKAIPREWMDELSDLVERERDRLGANTKD
jgi:hypothetical protein